ncbi:MAG: PaaI family thioesterase [Archaeoglobales archaeon]|jgi:acyl-CoA thioesterase|nr:PaaI family thioesterase [Archaeoglobi archaeon]NHW22796.1 PaaI family thioesterase [Archaeoglobales archaeon]
MDLVEEFVKLVGSAPWYRLIGMEIKRKEEGISVEIKVEEKHLQALGMVHGGAIASILDSAIGLNINKELIGKGKLAITSQLNVHYLKPVSGGKIIAKARPLFIGSKVAVGYGELKDEKGETVAVATSTFYITTRRE